MKKTTFLITILLCLIAQGVWALPKVHVIATGGTIAGTSSGSGYTPGQVVIEDLIAAVPELVNYAELDFEQYCQIGSQDMDETIWLGLSKRIDEVLATGQYDGIVVTHGTDTMEETSYFLNLTLKSNRPVILVGSMRPSDAPDADGPKNLLVAVKAAANAENVDHEVMCCINETLYPASGVYKNNSREIDAFAANEPDYYMPHNADNGFDISSIEALPQVGIIYGYGGCSELPLKAFVDAHFDGVVLAGVGDGNFRKPVQEIAEQAVKDGMQIVRATRCPHGGVYTEGGEVEDLELGFIPSGSLNPQKARVLLMLALTVTNDTELIREFFSKPIITGIRGLRAAAAQAQTRKYISNGKVRIQSGDKTYDLNGIILTE